MTIDQNEELRLLAALCRELAELGLTVGMSDAKPALSVRHGRRGARLWVWVGSKGELFEWCRSADGRHPAADPAGAAQRIADRLTSSSP
jgi:hypothetical protein